MVKKCGNMHFSLLSLAAFSLSLAAPGSHAAIVTVGGQQGQWTTGKAYAPLSVQVGDTVVGKTHLTKLHTETYRCRPQQLNDPANGRERSFCLQ